MGPQAPGEQPKLPIPGVKNIIAVGSGKGGVGKSTVAVNLAITLSRLGYAVGLMDADVYGPNVPLMMGIQQTPQAIGQRIQPLEAYGVRLMSMAFLNPGDKPLVWRGPMLNSVIQQFLRNVDWGELDYLVIDLPPGTGDVQLTLIQTTPLTGAVIVTTPSDVALEDARKAVNMFEQVREQVQVDHRQPPQKQTSIWPLESEAGKLLVQMSALAWAVSCGQRASTCARNCTTDPLLPST